MITLIIQPAAIRVTISSNTPTPQVSTSCKSVAPAVTTESTFGIWYFGALQLSLLPNCLRLTIVLSLFVQDLLHVLWLAAYKMGVPPIGWYTLSWTHGQAPRSLVDEEPLDEPFAILLY